MPVRITPVCMLGFVQKLTIFSVFDPPEDSPVQRFSRTVVPTSKKVKDQVFAFDRVFDENTAQADIYEGTTRSLLDSVLDGYNATVFAYGATGCGKTHTITGTAESPGIIFLTMQELFEKIGERSQEKTTELTLSYLEIYNETIRDLLVPPGSNKGGLMLREDSNAAVTVPGLTSHKPKDVQEVMDMIVKGNEFRTVSPTEANATSSRSHAVIQINIAQKDRNAGTDEPHTMATLSIIDLAGSERASVTKNRGERLTEGANINKSLLALGSCINALCDKRGKAHVPYRNSKLTRLLKFSLGGNCKTVMIVCISPSSAHFDETQNTLRYANRAKNIQTKVTRNVFNVNRHVKDFLVKIDEQMALITELRAQQKDAEKTFFAKFRKQSEKRQMIAKEGVQRLRTAYENAATERQDRISNMKKLKAFERRIGLLSGWIAAFDTVADQRGGEEEFMPANLSAIRKTAHGILLELENSRQHLHQKLDKSTWERAIDTALSHSISNLEGTDTGEIAQLTREAELLKANFNREAYREVLEQDKAGDAAMVQMLLTAQFDMLSSLSDTLEMDEEEAVQHAKAMINRLLQSGFAAASQVVKPDGSLPVVDVFPPTRAGTPKRKKAASAYVKPIAAPTFGFTSTDPAYTSPLKTSPRRRKVQGSAKKGISFTPVKKAPKGRAVRWRDDESEDGTLADFEKTPRKLFGSSPEQSAPMAASEKLNAAVEAVPVAEPAAEPAEESDTEPTQTEPQTRIPTIQEEGGSPKIEPPSMASAPGTKPSRFQAGFLSKGGRMSLAQGGSPVAPSLSLNLGSSPDTKRIPAPALRALDVAKTGNLSPPGRIPRRSLTPPRPLQVIMDENKPPNTSGSDSEGGIDTSKLRSAIHNAMKDKARRASIMTGSAIHKPRRVSSVGSIDYKNGPRPSMPVGSTLASSANGISRNRRSSADRKKSPPMPYCPEYKIDGSLTAGQARRMNLGGSLRSADNVNKNTSPREARRVTIGVGSGAGGMLKRAEAKGGMSWR